MKKWLKVLLVAQGFFLKKKQNNKLSHNTTGIENMAKGNSSADHYWYLKKNLLISILIEIIWVCVMLEDNHT